MVVPIIERTVTTIWPAAGLASAPTLRALTGCPPDRLNAQVSPALTVSPSGLAAAGVAASKKGSPIRRIDMLPLYSSPRLNPALAERIRQQGADDPVGG